MERSRKGFTYVKHTGSSLTTDPLSFEEFSHSNISQKRSNEEIHDNDNDNEYNDKNKRFKSSHDISSKSNEKSSEKSKNSKTPSKPTINNSNNSSNKNGKSYYPKTSLGIENIKKIDTEDKSHKELLISLLEIVCEQEITSIQNHFESKNNTSISRDIIKKNIMNFLTDLPNVVEDDCNDEIIFNPELSRAEKANIRSLSSVKESLKQKSQELDHYESDMNEFAKDYDIWFQNNLVDKLYEIVETSMESKRGDEAMAEKSEEYNIVLETIRSNCEVVLNGSRECEEVISNARQIKDSLYDVYKKARQDIDSSNNKLVPKDPKEIMKQLLNQY